MAVTIKAVLTLRVTGPALPPGGGTAEVAGGGTAGK
jgi:hypothetical protein